MGEQLELQRPMNDKQAIFVLLTAILLANLAWLGGVAGFIIVFMMERWPDGPKNGNGIAVLKSTVAALIVAIPLLLASRWLSKRYRKYERDRRQHPDEGCS